ncbi:IGDCC4 [Mytilus edulis]|uniref:IGDCC4 n=1 Tax=Mytilus edulis TaxID=6550 RepID=A0A8S3SCD7_MYTED|nr:IGDCC4 [Mytilus edulis]
MKAELKVKTGNASAVMSKQDIKMNVLYYCARIARYSVETFLLSPYTERRPPMIVAISKEVNATIKHSVTLECLADGNPSPVVTWMKDGNQTSDDSFNTMFDRSNIKLIKVDKNDAGTYQCVNPDHMLLIDSSISDSGYYQCIAKNDVGVDMAITRLQIILKDNVPKPPGHVTVTSVTCTGVCIRWFLPEYPKCCQSVLAILFSCSSLKSETSSSSPCSIDLKWDPLPPEICDGVITRYQIYVSKGGHDIMKNVSTAKHKYTIRVPKAAPNMRLYSSSPFSIDVEWDQSFVQCNGVNTGYQIYVSNGSHEIMQNVSSNNKASLSE